MSPWTRDERPVGCGLYRAMNFDRHPTPPPRELRLRRQSRVLEVVFDDSERYALPFEFLRVHSPSAEVKGHGPGQETLVVGKQAVGIRAIEPVGHYAVRLVFDDDHDSGLFSWSYLRELGRQQETLWRRYLERIEKEKRPGVLPGL